MNIVEINAENNHKISNIALHLLESPDSSSVLQIHRWAYQDQAQTVKVLKETFMKNNDNPRLIHIACVGLRDLPNNTKSKLSPSLARQRSQIPGRQTVQGSNGLRAKPTDRTKQIAGKQSQAAPQPLVQKTNPGCKIESAKAKTYVIWS